MKILVIGDSASGKSTFAAKLGKKLSIPVLHLDEVMDRMGRKDRESIQQFIRTEIAKENWIIDGNAFTKDEKERIRTSDIIYAFDFSPLHVLYNHVIRYLKLKLGIEKKRVGSEDTSLNLGYFIPYIFFKFPKRKRAAIALAKSLGKEVFIIRSRKRANQLIEN